MRDLLISLGVDARNTFAAFLGAIAAALFMPNATARQIVTVVFVGTVAGNYFGEYAADKLPFGRGGSCVLIGLTAMILARKAMDWAKAYQLGAFKGGDDAKQ